MNLESVNVNVVKKIAVLKRGVGPKVVVTRSNRHVTANNARESVNARGTDNHVTKENSRRTTKPWIRRNGTVAAGTK